MPTPKRARRDAATDATPYEGFADHEDRLSQRVYDAWPLGAEYPTWSKGGKGRKPQPLHVEDLAVGLWAIHCVGSKGISYGQLDCCFRVCRGVGCHNNKAAAIFALLQTWGLIIKVGNYSAGARGNVYEVVPEPTEFMGIRHEPPPPTPRPRAKSEPAAPTLPPPDDSDPW